MCIKYNLKNTWQCLDMT